VVRYGRITRSGLGRAIGAVAPRPAGNPACVGNFLWQYCTSVRVAATLSNPYGQYGIHNRQWGRSRLYPHWPSPVSHPGTTRQNQTFCVQCTAH